MAVVVVCHHKYKLSFDIIRDSSEVGGVWVAVVVVHVVLVVVVIVVVVVVANEPKRTDMKSKSDEVLLERWKELRNDDRWR